MQIDIFDTLPTMFTDLSDETLMLRYCEGNLSAFKELYRRHSQGLCRFIAWRVPRKDWVDEVVQDSWIALHHARAGYQPTAKFRTYLYQIARNRVVDQLRRHPDLLAGDLGHDADGDELFEHLADNMQDALSPEDTLIKKQEADGLRAALHALPSEQKEAVILQQFNDMSLEEIAHLSDVPVETVKSRLRYAMRKLRQQLGGYARLQEEQV